jgi:formylglycine-generating enzyme required for sulfatase activity
MMTIGSNGTWDTGKDPHPPTSSPKEGEGGQEHKAKSLAPSPALGEGRGEGLSMLSVVDINFTREQEVAHRQIELFEMEFAELYGEEYGEKMLRYACHAALPLTLTTELAYLLRQLVQEEYGINLPWTAAPELLLSNLCDTIGADLYAMDAPLREVLLGKLAETDGVSRLEELGLWMADYVYYRMQVDKKLRGKILGEPLEWIALAYFKKGAENTGKITQYLRELLERSDGLKDLIRWSEVDSNMRGILDRTGFSPVLWDELVRQLSIDSFGTGEVDRVRNIATQANFPTLQSGEITYNTIEISETAIETGDALFEFEFEIVTLSVTGKIITPAEIGKAKAFKEPLDQDVSLEMVAIPRGGFMMGSPNSEIDRYADESPQHEVSVKAFFLGKYPITQSQWQAIMGNNSSEFKDDDNLPIDSVSWLEAIDFCQKLSQKTGRNYRLPTEAEWEYACRAGTKTPFHFGETISSGVANYQAQDWEYEGNTYPGKYGSGQLGEYREKTTSVGSFGAANRFGLFDMHGNVWEWCLDHWHGNYEGAPIDGSAWLSDNQSPRYVIRGGSWDNKPSYCRSATRYYDFSGYSNIVFGFRVVCEIPRTS